MKPLIVASFVALGTVGVLASSLAPVKAAPRPGRGGKALVVTSVTPALNQETLPDFSDPGLNNRITVRFSTPVEASDLIEEGDPESPLTGLCDLRDHTGTAYTASGAVRQNVLTINPFTAVRPLLPQGRYTLVLDSSIRSVRGRVLNDGRSNFVTTFAVGPDVYPPMVLRASPAPGATGVALRRPIVVTFNEPMDAASAAASIRLEDRSTVPATQIPARVRLARRGFDVVVTPDARSGYPARTDVTLVIVGRGTSTGAEATLLTDEDGYDFTRDAGVQWEQDAEELTLFHSRSGDFDDVLGEFTLTFRTRGPGSPRR